MPTDREVETALPTSPLDGWLTRGSLLYLGIPILIWMFAWLRLPIACLAGGLTLAGLVGMLRSMPPLSRAVKWADQRQVLYLLLLAVVATSLSGTGGFGLQNWDHNKHNAVLHDLISMPIPVRYETPGDPALTGPLVYYLAWYMPAMLVGRQLGWEAANLVQFVWTFIGVWIGLLWFARRVGGGVKAGFFLLFFSGLHVLGALSTGKNFTHMTNLELHHWAWFAQYSQNLALINWVPQHVLPMWLGTGLVLHELEVRQSRRTLLGVVALLPLWSPWVAIGILPVCALAAWRGRGKLFALPELGLAVGILPVVGLFLLSNRGHIVKGLASDLVGPWFPVVYAGFVGFNFLILALLLLSGIKKNRTDLGLLSTSVGVLLLLPLFRVGVSNDLAMRGSLSALFVLAILACRGWQRRPNWALGLVLAVGALSPLHELGYSLLHYRFGPPKANEIRSLPMTDGHRYAVQFVGDPTRIFWTKLAR